MEETVPDVKSIFNVSPDKLPETDPVRGIDDSWYTLTAVVIVPSIDERTPVYVPSVDVVI